MSDHDSQPSPTEGDKCVPEQLLAWLEENAQVGPFEHCFEQAIELVKKRDELGQERYGTRLYTNNGRDVLQDAREEMADLMMYLAQAGLEGADLSELRQLYYVCGLLLFGRAFVRELSGLPIPPAAEEKPDESFDENEVVQL